MTERIFLMKKNIFGIVVQGWVLLVHCVHEVPAYCPKKTTTQNFKYHKEPSVIIFNFCIFSRAKGATLLNSFLTEKLVSAEY